MARERTLVRNPASGSADASEAFLERLGEDCEVLETGARDASELAESAARNGSEQVIAAGGDGTVQAVARGLLRSGARPELWILPAGSANDLARGLDLPLEPEAAWEQLRHGQTAELDVARVTIDGEEQLFVNALTAGNAGRIHDYLTAELKENWGAWSYVRASLELLFDLESYPIRLRCDDDEEHELAIVNLAVGNGRFAGGGIPVAPNADPCDGRLDLVAVRHAEAWQHVQTALHLALGDYSQSPLVLARAVRRLEIRSEREIPISLDGEVCAGRAIDVEVLEAALRIRLP